MAACLVALTVLSSPAMAQQPLVEVRLEGVGSVLVQGQLTSQGLLEVPIAPLEELTGERLGDSDYLTLGLLSRALGPQVDVDYRPRLALLVLRDPLRTLAATRSRLQRQQAEARGRPSGLLAPGWYGALTADERGERLVQGGWTGGRFAVQAIHSTLSGARWSLSARPFSRLWLTYEDGERGRASYGLRWAAGRTFVRASYVPGSDDLRGQAGASLGPWTAFVQEDGSAALTWTGPFNVTLARTPDGVATRLVIGRRSPPFILPRVR